LFNKKEERINFPVVIHFRINPEDFGVIKKLSLARNRNTSEIIRYMIRHCITCEKFKELTDVEINLIEAELKLDELKRLQERSNRVNKLVGEYLQTLAEVFEILSHDGLTSNAKQQLDLISAVHDKLPDSIKSKVNPQYKLLIDKASMLGWKPQS